MSAAVLARRLPAVRKLHALRERRLGVAETEAAQARAAMLAREADVMAADGRIAAIEDRRAEMEHWFHTRPDPRHIDAALARRSALADDRAREDQLRAQAVKALAEAEAEREEAARRLARARARLDLVAGQLRACRRAVEALGEAAAEEAYEDRARVPSRAAGLGAAA